MSIGVAIIGGGIFAREEHLPAVEASPLLTLKAVYSRSLKSAQSSGAKVDLYSDDSGSGNTYYDLLLRNDVQAVIIALPIPQQPEYIEAALAAGKHVLSEKPIAADIKRAEKLLAYYKSDKVKGGATWGVAENFRFLESFIYGAEEVKKLGRILNFRVKMFTLTQLGGKYIETPWRKKPEYQGGFLLDGGVHFVAGTRLLLGDDTPAALTAYTTLLQKHLPPVDTVNSAWQVKSGSSGTFSVSFGTTTGGSEYVVACEKGSVVVVKNTVTVFQGQQSAGQSTSKTFDNEGSGVKQEVHAWAEALQAGKPNPKQMPEEALADLEILEKMLKSGETHGAAQTLKLQV